MSSLNDWYLFDGNCECSKDADFTLTFDDNSCLKVSKCLLEMASPVLKTAIQQCRHDGILHLPQTSKDSWILILNRLHPAGRPDKYLEQITDRSPHIVNNSLTQCRKYGFESLHKDLDRGIAVNIPNYRSTFDESVRFDKYRYICANYNRDTFNAMVKFDLPKSEEAFVAYLVAVLEKNEEILKLRISDNVKKKEKYKARATRSVRDIVEHMHSAGCYRMSSLFSQKMMMNDIHLDLHF